MVRLDDAAPDICGGDLLLFRRWGPISIAGRGEHSHAGKADWPGDGYVRCVEVREWVGGRSVSLASQVHEYPGRIDVYQVNPGNRWPNYDRTGAVRYMRSLVGCDYGYWSVFCAALRHLPVIRCFLSAAVEDRSTSTRPPFCSQACAQADRIGGGVDPVPHLADRLTEPADMARSQFYKYRFTLTQ
jgi:hypothetical protein